MTDVVILAGGDPLPESVRTEIPAKPLVIAADSGLDHAMALGLDVHLRVGDFDSVSEAAMDHYADVAEERWPPDKDATDLEIAMEAAVRRRADRVLVIGGHGGRLDHLLANAALLASPTYSELEIVWLAGAARVTVARGGAELRGRPGELVSLIPVGDDVRGVSTSGLSWDLAGEALPLGTSRGVSNLLTGDVARIEIGSGTLLVIQPEALEGD